MSNSGEYDLSVEMRDPQGKIKLVPVGSDGRELSDMDIVLDYIAFALRMAPVSDLSSAVSMMVTSDRLNSYRGTDKAMAVPLSNDNVKAIKDAVLKVFNKFVLFRVMQIIDPSGLKE